MTELLATVNDVAARIGEVIEGEDIVLAEAMLAAASEHVRVYGKPWPTRLGAPAIARTITAAAAARGFMNPGGFTDERSDSVTLKRGEAYSRDTELTEEEKRMLSKVAGTSTLSSIGVTLGAARFRPRSRGRGRRWNNPVEHINIDAGYQQQFPFFRDPYG